MRSVSRAKALAPDLAALEAAVPGALWTRATDRLVLDMGGLLWADRATTLPPLSRVGWVASRAAVAASLDSATPEGHRADQAADHLIVEAWAIAVDIVGRHDERVDLVTTLPAFAFAVLLISASPGPAMALVFRRAALRGFRGAVPTVLGLEAGLYLWALFAGAGLAALVAASQIAYVVLRVVGAAFLVYLGIRAWRAAWRSRAAGAGVSPAAAPADPQAGDFVGRRGWWRAFGEGAVVMLANPKAAVFMVAFYPQFVPADRPLFATTALLAVAQVAIEVAFYLTLAAAVSRAGVWFRRPVIRRRLEAVSGTVLIGLGVRLATTSR